ncbi:MAG: hypothetical protein AAB370_01320 [Verrucomicrobiota bacterium]
MLKPIFTLDYEIHGNGDGCPHELMVEPTNRMLDLFEQYGAKLTIMADVAEILKFKEYKETTGRDDYHYDAIARQLSDAVRRGHDAQLHLHASYFNAKHEAGRWVQDWSEYNFAGLRLERLIEIVRAGKSYLEDLLQPVNPKYVCNVFRAANWSVSPSRNVVRALLANGITVDTSVFKHGKREGIVSFDYSNAHSDLLPWRADEEDICRRNPNGSLVEIPIYCERRWIGAFFSMNRLYRAKMTRAHRIQNLSPAPSAPGQGEKRSSGLRRKLALLTDRHAWKADFNQCTGSQLIRALERAEKKMPAQKSRALPFVLIGHSKQFTRANEESLRPFLAFVSQRKDRFGFATFGDCLDEVRTFAAEN